MTLEELLRDPIFDLPLSQNYEGKFSVFIESLLNRFLSKVKDLEESIDIPHVNVDLEFIKSTQNIVINGLIESVNEYYKGFPSIAYKKLSNVLSNSEKDLFTILKQKKYEIGSDFYRVRLKSDNFPFGAKEMFHIPFEMRGKVSTQRYSIPGFPSLYLGRTLYICWEELNRPQIHEFQAVRLQNIQKLNFLDLTSPVTEGTLTQEIYRYFMTWPLIACCSVKVKNHSDTFKPEYIIPQLLLQWVRSNHSIDGIRYKSTHVDQDLYKKEGELTNLVLPVKESRTEGHCSILKSSFEMTEVISWQLYQYALGGQIFLHSSDENKIIDDKLPGLELIKGMKYPYSYSTLGRLEQYLGYMKTQPIE